MSEIEALRFEGICKGNCFVVNLAGNRLEPLRAVIDRIHARHDCKQYLRCADVAGGLFTPDVLFSGLQCQPVGRGAFGIHTHSNKSAGHGSL